MKEIQQKRIRKEKRKAITAIVMHCLAIIVWSLVMFVLTPLGPAFWFGYAFIIISIFWLVIAIRALVGLNKEEKILQKYWF